MSDLSTGATDTATEDPKPGLTTRLMDSLIPLGEALPESHKPSPATLSQLVAGLLYWLETGSTEPPVLEIRQETPVTTKDAEIEQLRAEMAALKAQIPPATPVPASPVAPASTSPQSPAVTTPAVTPGEPASTQVPPAAPAPPVSDVPSTPAS